MQTLLNNELPCGCRSLRGVNGPIRIEVLTSRSAAEEALRRSKEPGVWERNEIWLWPDDPRFQREEKRPRRRKIRNN